MRTLCASLFCVLLIGCQPLERTALEVAAAATGFIVQAQANHHDECVANPRKAFPCVQINQAIGARDALLDAAEAYCQWPVHPTAAQVSTAPCARLRSAKQALAAAVSNVQAILPDLQRAASGLPPRSASAKAGKGAGQ